MKEYFKQFFYLLDAQARKAIPFLIGSFLISSLLDVIGIGLIGLFIGLLANLQLFLQNIPQITLLQGLPEKRLILYSGLLIVGAFAIKTTVMLYVQFKLVTFCQSLSVRLKTRLMKAYQSAPYTHQQKKNSAYMVSKLQENVNTYINSVLMPTFNLISSGLIAVFILFFLLILQPLSTLFLVAMFALLVFGFDIFAKKKLSMMGKAVAITSGAIVQAIHQGLYGLNEARIIGKEQYFLERLKKASGHYADAYGRVSAIQLTPRYLTESILAIFIVGLCLSGIALGFEASHMVALVSMFAAAGIRLLPTVGQIMTSINQVRGSYHHMYIICNDLVELDSLAAEKQPLHIENKKIDFAEIRLDNVSYHYPNSDLVVLNELNLKIIKGQSIGLIGPSGAGKSTLVNLILGFLEPTKGCLWIDNKVIEHPRMWLNNFAYIPQAIFLLDDTLRRNIAFGTEDHEIDEAQVRNAIKMACLEDVMPHLPDGLDTMIGENGVRLSGGQRQRVALARAFYYQREIIIMDEATSSLDDKTESEVINTIKRLKGNKTIIAIAHRLSTVEHCDVLYRIEQGRVTASGTYQEVVGNLKNG